MERRCTQGRLCGTNLARVGYIHPTTIQLLSFYGGWHGSMTSMRLLSRSREAIQLSVCRRAVVFCSIPCSLFEVPSHYYGSRYHEEPGTRAWLGPSTPQKHKPCQATAAHRIPSAAGINVSSSLLPFARAEPDALRGKRKLAETTKAPLVKNGLGGLGTVGE